MMNLVRRYIGYGLILILVGIGTLALLTIQGPQVGNVFGKVTNGLAGAGGYMPPQSNAYNNANVIASGALPQSKSQAQATAMSPGNSDAARPALAAEQRLVKTAQLTETVDDVELAVSSMTGIAADTGGYVFSTRTFMQGEYLNSEITLMVPSGRFEEALNRIRSVAVKIEQETAGSQDVTADYVDLEARLKNLEATAARLRSFMNAAQTVQETLNVNKELSGVESEIERIKGQLSVLEARTTFSTITVSLRPVVAPTLSDVPWQPLRTLTGALNVQGSLLRHLADAFIWFWVVLAPYLLLGGLSWLLYRWFVGWRSRSVSNRR